MICSKRDDFMKFENKKLNTKKMGNMEFSVIYEFKIINWKSENWLIFNWRDKNIQQIKILSNFHINHMNKTIINPRSSGNKVKKFRKTYF